MGRHKTLTRAEMEAQLNYAFDELEKLQKSMGGWRVMGGRNLSEHLNFMVNLVADVEHTVADLLEKLAEYD